MRAGKFAPWVEPSYEATAPRVAWFYLIACFPPIFLLSGQALGDTLLVYGALTARSPEHTYYGAVRFRWHI